MSRPWLLAMVVMIKAVVDVTVMFVIAKFIVSK